MKKLLAFLTIIFLIWTSGATRIQSEEVTLDLEEGRADVSINFSELTSSEFSYLTAAEITSVETPDSRFECRVEDQSIGDEIICKTDLRKNFLVELSYSFRGVVEEKEEKNVFRYTHPIYRPTENFRLRVRLPQGAGLVNSKNLSASITPDSGRVGSNGQSIFVEWKQAPEIGDTLDFEIRYRSFKSSRSDIPLAGYIGIGVLGVLLIYLVYRIWIRINREDIEKAYEQLSEDERKVMEMLVENDGEMLQKDVVDDLEYSKAKVSGIVSGLVEKEMVVKKKEGRSNKLSIPRDFSY